MRNIVEVKINTKPGGRSSLIRKKKLKSKTRNLIKDCEVTPECIFSSSRDCTNKQCSENSKNVNCFPEPPFKVDSSTSNFKGTCVECFKDYHCSPYEGCDLKTKTCSDKIKRKIQGSITNSDLKTTHERFDDIQGKIKDLQTGGLSVAEIFVNTRLV